MDIRSILMGLTFALIWSSAFTSARIIVQENPPLYISGLRFLIAGLLAVSIAYLLGQRAHFSAKQWRAIILFGICQNAVYLGLNFVAMQTIEASLASIIASAMPLFVGAILVLFFKEPLPPIGIFGLIIGFSGVVLIMGMRLTGAIDLWGIGLCLIAVVSLAIATLTIKSASTGNTLLMVVGMQMLVGAAVLLPIAGITESLSFNWTPTVLAAFAYTLVFPGIIATYIWFRLVERIGSTKAASFHFLNPFFGVAIAALLLNENLTVFDCLGVMVIMVGIGLVQRARTNT